MRCGLLSRVPQLACVCRRTCNWNYGIVLRRQYVSLTGNFGGTLDTADRLWRYVSGVSEVSARYLHSVTTSVLLSRNAFICGSRILQRVSFQYFSKSLPNMFKPQMLGGFNLWQNPHACKYPCIKWQVAVINQLQNRRACATGSWGSTWRNYWFCACNRTLCGKKGVGMWVLQFRCCSGSARSSSCRRRWPVLMQACGHRFMPWCLDRDSVRVQMLSCCQC
jgi:hypothetical protein